MNTEAFKLAHATLRTAVHGYGWSRNRTIWHGRPTAYRAPLGKFQGEHWSVVHWFDAAMEGDGEEFHGADGMVECVVFKADANEMAAFGLKRPYVVLDYSSNGFVTMVPDVGEGAVAEMRARYEAQAGAED